MLSVPLKRMLFGLGDEHVIVDPTSNQLLHPEALVAFQRLCRDARDVGFSPKIVSGFRAFDRQLLIWNSKVSGERPLLDTDGSPLDVTQLGEAETVFAILRWSALPGASRHHWGTDFDVIDAAAVDDNYVVQLTPQEVADNGVFGAFHRWLDERIDTGHSYGLFRPYAQDRGGVAPERWHLSYAPRARELQELLSLERLYELLQETDLAMVDTVCEYLQEIYTRYVWVPDHCYPTIFGR
ncbi:M15 family metallopeptidase [Microbulbifer sp. OS29]|uniref:M15 family metallopeptidase n=1 Tax=Microbulbifer okhotskensis TaxID=2926617 RepID=A0A9X2J6I5_9GAMM|nr:M15 family metallopeptidase [Microbulbifer okhotskensis]MCO1334650.1 M15 family metallopeptidase [Microbulbifer okhotskensis]